MADTAIAALGSAAVLGATPLVLTAMGGVVSERSGVVNIGLEGLMLAGAFAGIWAGRASGAAGLAAALAVGAAAGCAHAWFTQRLRMDHVVSGLGVNLLAYGLTRYLALTRFPASGVQVAGLPAWPFVAAAVAAPIVLAAALGRTRWGLRVRAAGESAEGARLAGVDPVRVRFGAVALGGALAAAGGAYLSLADAHTFSSGMSAGKGYIALAAVIFGKWRPVQAALGALLFGLGYALETQIQIGAAQVRFAGIEWSSPYLLDTLPYVVTLAVLVLTVGRIRPPADLGAAEPETA